LIARNLLIIMNLPSLNSQHNHQHARVLVGWMSQQQVEHLMSQSILNDGRSELIHHVNEAQATVAARVPEIDQTDLLGDIPSALGLHLKKLESLAIFAPLAAEGWSFKLADLGKVCALQPHVFRDQAMERTQGAVQADLLALALITLPIPEPAPLPLHFDAARNTWIVTSRNQNLQIVGHFSGPVNQHLGCGFLVGVMPSFVQVALFRGRYVLIDGYHRSLGLLARGIRKAPVLFREFAPSEPLQAGGALKPDFFPEAVFLGERPPLLPDYLDEKVSVEVQMATSGKMLIIQGLEISPPD
jgi:hypothetical protein